MFNIASDRCVVLQESLIGPTAPLRYVTTSLSVVNPHLRTDTPKRRLVDEYTRDEDGRYRLTQWDVEFSQYLCDQVPLAHQNVIVSRARRRVRAGAHD